MSRSILSKDAIEAITWTLAKTVRLGSRTDNARRHLRADPNVLTMSTLSGTTDRVFFRGVSYI
ncbi:MAG TPA: hypothetical protein VK172_10420 [Lentimicrobium sp.]|nr:hypothetical protein [Lentimicrobium sp.]